MVLASPGVSVATFSHLGVGAAAGAVCPLPLGLSVWVLTLEVPPCGWSSRNRAWIPYCPAEGSEGGEGVRRSY